MGAVLGCLATESLCCAASGVLVFLIKLFSMWLEMLLSVDPVFIIGCSALYLYIWIHFYHNICLVYGVRDSRISKHVVENGDINCLVFLLSLRMNAIELAGVIWLWIELVLVS